MAKINLPQTEKKYDREKEKKMMDDYIKGNITFNEVLEKKGMSQYKKDKWN